MAKIMREYPYHDVYLLDDARLFRAELTMPQPTPFSMRTTEMSEAHSAALAARVE